MDHEPKEAMKRVYTRGTSGTYEGMGYIWQAGHMELDYPPNIPNIHVLTPTSPVKVICQLNGEVVETVRIG